MKDLVCQIVDKLDPKDALLLSGIISSKAVMKSQCLNNPDVVKAITDIGLDDINFEHPIDDSGDEEKLNLSYVDGKNGNVILDYIGIKDFSDMVGIPRGADYSSMRGLIMNPLNGEVAVLSIKESNDGKNLYMMCMDGDIDLKECFSSVVEWVEGVAHGSRIVAKG